MGCSRRAVLLPILMLVAGLSRAQNLADAARELAAKIALRIESGERAAVVVRNLSSLGPAEVAEVRRALEAALPRQGTPAEVRVTLSENRQGLLWVAEIGQQVAMLKVPRTAASNAAAAGPVIDKRLLWEQDSSILDVAPADGLGLLVLGAGEVSLDREGKRETVRINSSRPWPRDLRGRLELEGGSFRAYLPGIVCRGPTSPPLRADCRESDEPWPLYAGNTLLGRAHLAAGRNYFDGRVVTPSGTSRKLAPFFSAAAIEQNGETAWILAPVDSPGTLGAVGGDIASIENPCGARWLALATRPGDADEADGVQAYDVVEGRPVAVGQPVEFPGPVTALWPMTGGGAVAVARDLQTGRYAAYRVALRCGSRQVSEPQP